MLILYMSVLFGNILGCLLGGFLLSLLLTGICYLIPKGMYAHPQHSVGSIAVLLVSFFFFLFQSTLLVGGFKAKRYVGQAKAAVESFSNGNPATILPEKSNGQINWYIARRFGWLVGGLLVTGVAMYRLCEEDKRRATTRYRRHYPNRHSSRRYHK
ncbi:MAG: hypothetical protein J6K31_10505 [Parabacteroides sp.]|nr:hypothetical protein [Parabacteroides sp.]